MNNSYTKSTIIKDDSSCRWDITILDKIGYWSTGGTPSRKNSHYYGGNIPWIKSGDLNDSLIYSTSETINEEGLSNSNAKILPEGTVSMALYGATIGKLGILGKPAATNQACANCIVIPEMCSNKFLFYYLRSQRQDLIEAGQGGAQPNLTNKIVRNWSIPLPPLQEQQQIVAQIEKLLARVNAAKERLDRVPAIMQQFRQSVLAAACSGELTEKWRERNQCENSSEFLECVNVDYPYKLPPTWKIVKLYDIAAKEKYSITDGPFGSNLKTEHYTESGPRVIRLQNIGNGQFLNLFSHISQEHYETLNKHHIFPSDLVVALLGDPIPRCCIIPDDIGPAIVKADCVRFKPNNDLVNSKFVMYAINEPNIRELIKESVHGVARPRLNLKQIKSLLLPLPPLEEQYEIVHRLDVLFTHANRIEDQVTAARERVETVTQSILHQAFTGRLLPTNNVAES